MKTSVFACVFLGLILCIEGVHKRHAVITTGTTIIVFVHNDSIVLVADRRGTTLSSNKEPIYDSHQNKIFNVGNLFFIHAGASKLGNVSLESIIKQTCDTNISIDKNATIIHTKLREEYNKYFNSLKPDEALFYTKERVPLFGSTIFIATYIGNIPTIYKLVYAVEKIQKHNFYPYNAYDYYNYAYNIIDTIPLLDTIRLNVKVEGYRDHILDTINKGFHVSADLISDGIKLISLEAKYHIEVDSNIDYVVIKPKSFKYGKNYKNR